MNKIIRKFIFSFSCIGLLSTLSISVFAGGFQLFEQSASALGNAFAGTSASAEDASTGFYNPAGLTRIENEQIVIAGTALGLDISSNVTSATSQINGLAAAPVTGVSNSKPGSWGLVPAFNLAVPFHQDWAFGFGLTAPFGLDTVYPLNSMPRFLATQSSIFVVNAGPSLAYQVNPKFSVGGGVDIQYIEATLNQQIPTLTTNGTLENHRADDVGYGWNLGVLYEFAQASRVGLAYRSRVEHNLRGDASLATPTAFIRGGVQTKITLPDSVNLGVVHDFNERWTGLGGIVYTHWSTIQTVMLNYSGTITSAVTRGVLPLNFQDTYRISAGANYHATDRLMLRGGIAYDQSPVPNAVSRTFSLPDSTRYWLAIGAQYKYSDAIILDAGYAHLFVQNSNLNTMRTNLSAAGVPTFLTAIANFNSQVNEVGVQLTWNII